MTMVQSFLFPFMRLAIWGGNKHLLGQSYLQRRCEWRERDDQGSRARGAGHFQRESGARHSLARDRGFATGVIQRNSEVSPNISKEKEMKKIIWIFGLAATLVTAFAMAQGTMPSLAMSPSDKHLSAATVKIDNFSFGPATITIPAGSTVTWTNNDDVPHVVSSDDNKMFKSKALNTDDHFSFTFTKPGTYDYYCAIHPKMTAKIVVQ
jgi:plastocyanin